MTRSVRTICILVVLAITQSVRAETYPDQAVRVIVQAAPEGSIDIAAHMVGNKLGERRGQSVVIDNPVRASMIIGAEQAIKSILAGETQVCIADSASAASVLRSGKLTPLAVTSAWRFDLFPELPVEADSGVPGNEVRAWMSPSSQYSNPESILTVT